MDLFDTPEMFSLISSSVELIFPTDVPATLITRCLFSLDICIKAGLFKR